jgi:hypothetical protein
MRPGALRRATSAAIVIAASALLVGNHVVGGTWAVFNGQTKNAGSVFSDGWLSPAAAGSVAASGWNMNLAWTPGAVGLNGQQLWGVDNNLNSNCTGAAYASLTTLASAATAAFTDTARGTALTNGHWFCYEIMSTRTPGTWTTPYAMPAAQLGLVTTAVANANVTTAGTFRANDTITLTFNQRIATTGIAASGSLKVCLFAASRTILIGDTAATCNAATDAFSVAKLVAGAGTVQRNVGETASTYVLTTVSPFTMTITLAGTATTATITGLSSWTLTASATPRSFANAATTMCTALTTNCQPTTATNF